MTPEKWQNIVGNIKDNFDVLDEGKEHLEEQGGVDVDFIEFLSPRGRMRLELIVKPVILNKKTSYSHRGGSETGIEYVYSQNEKTCRLEAYEWDDNIQDWNEISANNFL